MGLLKMDTDLKVIFQTNLCVSCRHSFIKTSQIHFCILPSSVLPLIIPADFMKIFPEFPWYCAVRERKDFSTLQRLHSTLAAIQPCLYIQHEVQHPNSLKYSGKTICRSPRILQMLRHEEALKIHFDPHFNTNAH